MTKGILSKKREGRKEKKRGEERKSVETFQRVGKRGREVERG